MKQLLYEIKNMEVMIAIELLEEVKAEINRHLNAPEMKTGIAMIVFDRIATTKYWHSKGSVNIADHNIARAWRETTHFCDAVDPAIKNLKCRIYDRTTKEWKKEWKNENPGKDSTANNR